MQQRHVRGRIISTCIWVPENVDYQVQKLISYLDHFFTLFHMGGVADSTRPQIVFFITSIKDAAEQQNLTTFNKI